MSTATAVVSAAVPHAIATDVKKCDAKRPAAEEQAPDAAEQVPSASNKQEKTKETPTTWRCEKCNNFNTKKSRCSKCLAWKGGRRLTTSPNKAEEKGIAAKVEVQKRGLNTSTKKHWKLHADELLEKEPTTHYPLGPYGTHARIKGELAEYLSKHVNLKTENAAAWADFQKSGRKFIEYDKEAMKWVEVNDMAKARVSFMGRLNWSRRLNREKGSGTEANRLQHVKQKGEPATNNFIGGIFKRVSSSLGGLFSTKRGASEHEEERSTKRQRTE